MEQKIKVMYLITKSTQGGAQRNVYDLAINLPKDAFNIAVFAGGDGWLLQELRKKDIHAESFPFLSRAINLFSDIHIFFNLLFLFIKERPNVVHLHSSKIGGLGALAGRLVGVKKIIFTAHGWAFNEPWRTPLMRAFIWLFSWLTALFAHHIIVITKKEYDQTLRMAFISKNKVVYIPNGIGVVNFLPQREARETLLGKKGNTIPPSTIWLGTISELTINKGLTYAIKAIAILIKDTAMPPFIFVIIGEGEKRKSLEKQIVKQKLSDTVFLVGHKKDAQTLLQAFDIFTLTSLKEGLPYAILEAGLASLPITASDAGGIPDIVDNESGILVPPKDSRAIAEALSKLIKNTSLRQHLGENNALKMKERYSLQTMLDKTIALYK